MSEVLSIGVCNLSSDLVFKNVKAICTDRDVTCSNVVLWPYMIKIGPFDR